MSELKATGIISGIGTLLIGARTAGYRITGNVEPRSYYRINATIPGEKNTFQENFGVPIRKDLAGIKLAFPDVYEDMKDADIAMGHNECGSYSRLATNQMKVGNRGDFDWTFEQFHILTPKIFILDNLALSLNAISPHDWVKEFPDYHIYPIPVSNAHYGNPQKNRTRCFFIGVRKDLDFVPYSGEGPADCIPSLRDAIGDLQTFEGTGEFPNHEAHTLTGIAGGFRPRDFEASVERNEKLTWDQVREGFRELKEGERWQYFNKEGLWKFKIGFAKAYKEKHTHVLAGSLGGGINPWTNLPFSLRERARIQGIPDDFIFHGLKLEDDGRWNLSRNSNMVRQISKGMPIQWATWISTQTAKYFRGEKQDPVGHYNYQPEIVSAAKQIICRDYGYGEQQKKACETCWLREKCDVTSLRNESLAFDQAFWPEKKDEEQLSLFAANEIRNSPLSKKCGEEI